MPHEFVHEAQPSRIVFGAGTLMHLERELQALGIRQALVLCTARQAAFAHTVAERVHAAGVFAEAAMHVPIETASRAREAAQRVAADGVIAIGGGSTIGLAKAIALESGLPILAIPTTYAGSEVTSVYGYTEGGLKKTGRDKRVLPRTVIYDPELTLRLPVAVTVTSAFNAIAHAAEGLYARDRNPITDLMAEEGIRALARSLPVLVQQPTDLAARSDALYGAWLCGTVLGAVGMALHHKLCHTLGGSFGLPHAETHTVLLPHVLAFNADAAPHAMARIASALQATDAPSTLFDLAVSLGAPRSLKDLGMPESDLDRAADIAASQAYWNPRPAGPEQRAALRMLLQDAHDGVLRKHT